MAKVRFSSSAQQIREDAGPESALALALAIPELGMIADRYR